MCFPVATADGDRHSRSDGGSDRPRGRRGPEPSLSEGRQAEAVGQAEELKRCWTSTEGRVQHREGPDDAEAARR